MSKMIELEIGALAPKIAAQMKNQGIKIEQGDLDQLQKDADAIVRLHIRGFLNDSTVKKVREKLFYNVKKAVKGAS